MSIVQSKENLKTLKSLLVNEQKLIMMILKNKVTLKKPING